MYVYRPITRRGFNGVRLLLLGALVGASLTAQAQVTPSNDAAFNRFMVNTVGAGQNTVNFSTTGSPLATTAAATLATDGTANASLSRPGNLYNPSGNPVAVTAKGLLKPAVFAPLLMKGLGLVPIIGVGLGIYEVAKEAGFTLNPDKSVTKDASVVPTSGVRYGGYGTCAAPEINCAEIAAGRTWAVINNGASCQLNGGSAGTFQAQACTYNVSSPAAPSNLQELENAIASKSGWPTTSKLPKAINEAQQLTGDAVKLDTPTVTGPATSTGTTKTINNPDGTKQIQTVTHNHTYQGDKVTTSTVTVTQNYNTSNVVTSTTTQTETPAPDKTTDDCAANPNRVGCSDLDTPEVPIEKNTKNVTFTPVDLGVNATGCPAPLSVNMGQYVGTRQLEFTAFCDTAVKMRPFIVAASAIAAMMLLVLALKV